jgi:hypothetical protein
VWGKLTNDEKQAFWDAHKIWSEDQATKPWNSEAWKNRRKKRMLKMIEDLEAEEAANEDPTKFTLAKYENIYPDDWSKSKAKLELNW